MLQLRIHFVLRRKIHDRVILDIEIRSAEIQFSSRAFTNFASIVVRNFLHQR